VANLNPWTEVAVDTENQSAAPAHRVRRARPHRSARAIANASFKQQEKNRSPTEFVEMKGRGHALTIDSGWREAADRALAFVERFVRA
jgi:hypothetical protein